MGVYQNNFSSSLEFLIVILLILSILSFGALLFGFFSKNQPLSLLFGLLLPVIPFYNLFTSEMALWIVLLLSGLTGWFSAKEEQNPETKGFYSLITFSLFFLLLIFIIKFYRIN
ncbi:hypothetical protein [Methanolapillus ohkumae]|uniref:hypothetical protein n=1 Tax=Methanolapillus ohkumae TaxID=3028298 RepID=UPI0030B87861